MQFKKRAIALITAFIFIFSSAAFSVNADIDLSNIDNLVQNGGFEEGVAAWQSSYNVRDADEANPAYEGTKYGQLWGAGWQIYQEISVEKNTDYMLSFAYKNIVINGNSNQLRVYVTGDGIAVGKPAPANGNSLIGASDPKNPKEAGVLYDIKSEWTKINERFNSGDNSTIYVAFVNYGYGVGTDYKGECIDDVFIGCIAPETTETKISGISESGNALHAITKVGDPIGDKVIDSDFRWQISDDENGIWEDIHDSAESKYEIKKADIGRYIRYAAVPQSEAPDGSIKRGKEKYSKALLIKPASDNISIDISALMNGIFIGTKSDAEQCDTDNSIGGYILNREELEKYISDNNALTSGNISYSADIYGTKRAVSAKDGKDLTINLNGNGFQAINVLMTYKQIPENEQYVVVEYTDGSSEQFEYEAGSVMEKNNSLICINDTPLGVYGIEDNADRQDCGFVYSYTFNTDEEKEIETIEFPYSSTGDELLVFAVTGTRVGAAALEQMISRKITGLPQTITKDNRSDIEEIISLAEICTERGGNPEKISGYNEIKKLLIDVEKYEVKIGLYNFTAEITFSGSIDKKSIGYDTVSVEGLDNTQYDIEKIINDGKIIGIKIIVINRFDYNTKNIVISKDIASEYEPNFEIGHENRYSLVPKKILEANNVICEINNNVLNVNVSVKNNSDEQQSCYIVCGVYTDENEMIYSAAEKKIIEPGNTITFNKSETVGESGKKAKLFIWNSPESLKIIYQ